uniref:Diphthine--ammonia ligase n=1 Tax=Rhabditophanes sp. KR3021 TaxID=114890 RepID=A0AC35U9M4_9BILA
MKVCGLISGGKDSIYNLMLAKEHGHEIVCLANLFPPPNGPQELDSYMYQCVGSEAVHFIGEAMNGMPLFRKQITGKPINTEMEYKNDNDEDEVEDLYLLMQIVLKNHPDVQAVSVGAIESEYQKKRVEHVCQRLGLKMLAYMWKKDQKKLLDDMIRDGVNAIIIKVAAAGLTTKFLGQSIKEARDSLHEVEKKFHINVCGEGGEYETFVVDCPLFTQRINITLSEAVLHTPPDDTVSILLLQELECGPKYAEANV